MLTSALAAQISAATSPLYTSPGTAVRTDASGYTIGMLFTLGDTPLEVTSLGVWDQSGDGLLAAHDVGLWDDGGTLLASATVPAGTAGALVSGEFRFADLPSPVTLPPHLAYRLGSLQTGSEPFYEANGTAAFTSYVSGTPTAVYGYDAGGLTVPTSPGGLVGYLGPNLLFNPLTPPPEPPHGWLDATPIAQSSQDGLRSMARTVDQGELTGPLPDSPSGPFPTSKVNVENFWLTAAGDTQRYIVWDFGDTFHLGSAHIWNFNYTSPYNYLGAQTIDVYGSPNNVDWFFVETLTLSMSPGADGDPGETKRFATPFQARYVRFSITSAFPDAPDTRVGLSEVVFYAIPEPTTLAMLVLGVVVLSRGRSVRPGPASRNSGPEL